MKKILFSLAVVLGMASCTTWDDEHTQSYGDGPSVAIDLTTTTDSTFTFTVNPAQGTNYYTYAVVAGSEAQDISATTVYKNQVPNAIASAITKYENSASVTVNMRNAKGAPLCSPNTSYVVYAVAASDKGVVGKVTTIVVKTTDGKVPVAIDVPEDVEGEEIAVTFSESVQLQPDKVTAKYYREWDPEFKAIDVPSEDIIITVANNKAVFKVQNVPAGAYVFFSWPEGAFVDSFGNGCPAMNSDFNWSTGALQGVALHLTNKSWAIKASNLSPEAGTLIRDYTTFEGTMEFDMPVFRNDEEVEAGDISVVYTTKKKSLTIALDPTDWSVSGNKVTFHLPEAAEPGAIITIKVKADVLFDICGNGNEAFETTSKDVWWKYFAATKDMILGSFSYKYTSAYDDEPEWYDDELTVTIEEDADLEGRLIIKNFYLEGSEIIGYYDLNSGMVYIYPYFELGTVEDKNQTYGLITYSQSGKDAIPFTINPDGTLTSTDMGIVACDENYESALGWFEKMSNLVFYRPSAAAAKTRSAKAFATNAKKAVSVKVNPASLKTISK